MISFKNLTYNYKNTTDGLKNFSLDIEKGEFVVLCGMSGCGKTTAIRLINGLAFHFYEGSFEGDVLVEGKSVKDLNMPQISMLTASVFQDPREGFFASDAEGEIAFPLENYGIEKSQIKKKVDESLNALKIEDLRHKRLVSMSSGQKQKVAIASVYALSPSVYVFDEPSSTLDHNSIIELKRLMRQLKDEGKTIVVSEHRINYLMDLADKFVYLHGGEIKQVYLASQLVVMDTTSLQDLGLRSTATTQKIVPQTKNQSKNINTKPLLEAKNLHFSYGKNSILNNLNLSFLPKNIVALTGENGKGKTTLLRALCGLNKAKGEIIIDGKCIKRRNRFNEFWYCPNDTSSQFFTDSLTKELLLSVKRGDKEQIDTDQILKAVGLFEHKDKHPLTLSGGQKQRLAIACALASKRKVLLLDEPTSGLDYLNMRKIATALKLFANSGGLVIVSTHDKEFINECCGKNFEL